MPGVQWAVLKNFLLMSLLLLLRYVYALLGLFLHIFSVFLRSKTYPLLHRELKKEEMSKSMVSLAPYLRDALQISSMLTLM
jgi:hypothetical protein